MPGVDAVDLQALRFVEEEGLVDSAGEPVVEGGGVVGADDEEVLGVGDSGGFVVDHGLVAVEGEAVVHVALDGVGGDEFDVRGFFLYFASEGAGGVVDIELFAVEAEQEDEHGEDGQEGDVTHLGDSPASNDDEDDGGEEERGDKGGGEPLHGGDEGLVLHVLGGEGEDEDKDCAHGGVGPEEPVGKAFAADAVEVVGGEDGEGRDGGKDVAGEFGAGEGEEEDGEESPEDEELGEGVTCASVAEVAAGVVPDFPLGYGDLDGVNEGADGHDGPGHEADEKDDEVVPGGLVVLEAIGGEALEIVFEEEEAVEGGVAALDLDVPGEDHDEEESDAGPPNGSSEERPLAAESGEEKDDGEREERGNGAFGEGCGGSEEVKVEEPEFLAGFVPGVPAEHADAEGRSELHVGGGSAGEADDGDAGDRD